MTVIKDVKIFLLGLLFLLGCGGHNKVFDLDGYENNPSKYLKKYIQFDQDKDNALSAIKKVAIIEFEVEFLVDIPDSVGNHLADEMYKLFVESLGNNNSWETISKNLVVNNDVYRNLLKQTSNSFSDGRLIYSSRPLKILKYGIGNMRKVVRPTELSDIIEPAILEEYNADAALKVYTVIGLRRNRNESRVVILPYSDRVPASSQVKLSVGYLPRRATYLGYRAEDGNLYSYEYESQHTIKLKEPIVSYYNIQSESGTFNREDFVNDVLEMYGIYADLVTMEIDKHL